MRRYPRHGAARRGLSLPPSLSPAAILPPNVYIKDPSFVGRCVTPLQPSSVAFSLVTEKQCNGHIHTRVSTEAFV